MKQLALLIALTAAFSGTSVLPADAASSATARASSNMPVYYRPSLNSRVVGHLAKGERVHLEFCSIDAVWCHVVDRTDGPDGWVVGSYLVGMPAKNEVTPYRFDFNPLNPIPNSRGRFPHDGGGRPHP